MQTTAYNRIAASLRNRILSGDWEGQNKLPTEREFCDEFRASRITIRRALQIVEDEGLVERRQGLGTFVKPNAARKIPLLNTDFFGSIESHAPDLKRRVEAWGPATINADVATVLNLFPRDEVMNAIRVDFLNDVPVATDELFLVKAVSGHLTKRNLTRMNFLAEWADVQRIEMAHCTQRIEATRARKPISTLLRIRSGALLLKETNVVHLMNGTVAGLIVTHYRHDYFRFDSTIDLSSPKAPGRSRG